MSGGLIIAGRRVEVPGVNVVTWEDDAARAPKITDGHRRDPSKVLAFCLHTSKGRRCSVKPGARPSNRAELLARYQARTERDVSWHLTVDTDGDVLQQEDLATWMAWHVEEANGWTVGAELIQHEDDHSLWEVQVAAAASVVEATCAALSIPRRVLVGPDGAPWVKPVPALVMKKYRGPGQRWAGVLGHCNVVPDTVRGPGDPGPWAFAELLRRGFEAVDVRTLGAT